MLAAGCTQPSSGSGGGGSGGVNSWTVNPAVVDPATTSDPQALNVAYGPTGTPRGELAVMLHGTGSNPQAHYEIAANLRARGFHVILLRYSASLGTLGACPDSGALSFPDCHRQFRSETIFGAGVTDPDGNTYDHPTANISQADSVSNRLLKLVDFLDGFAPTKGWDQFQQSTGGTCDTVNATYGVCDLDWSKVSALGHSQGAGVVLYLGKFFDLNAIGLLSGPFDSFEDGSNHTVAPWITEGGMDTPASDIRSLTHLVDYSLGRIRSALDALGVAGPEVDFASGPPYGSNRLVTSAGSTCPWDASRGHNSTAVDVCSPDYLYYDAWSALAGA